MISVPWQWGQWRTCRIMRSLGWLGGCSASHTPREHSRPTPLKHPPVELQRHHGSLGANEQRILRTLKDHTAPVLRRIRSTIGGDFHLQRAALVQKVLGELETAQVVL